MNDLQSYGALGVSITAGDRIGEQHQRKPWIQPRLETSPVKITLHDYSYGDVDSPGEDPDNPVDGSRGRSRPS